jgi:hypothetical protein
MKKKRIKAGDRVRMSDAFKAINRDNENVNAHIAEFGNCIGIVEGSAYDADEEYQGPELDVRWQPSKLRYSYDPINLTLV